MTAKIASEDPFDEPRAPLGAELYVFIARREQIDVVVRVNADAVSVVDELLEPVDVRLLERPSDEEEVDHAARGFYAWRGFQCVSLHLVVELPF
jgi:hypothetical protein